MQSPKGKGILGSQPGTKSSVIIIQTTKLIHTSSGELWRTTPKQIPQDKERLYEEIVHLNQFVNLLKEEHEE